MSGFEISVKVIPRNSHQTSNLNLMVDGSWTGLKLRRDVANLSGQSPGEIRLIFAGKEIVDSHTIQELEIAENTTIHAVRGKPGQLQSGDRNGYEVNYDNTADTSATSSRNVCGSAILTPVSTDAASCNNSDADLKPRFYVYCKFPCQSVHPGKLRVRCQRCKDDAFLVTQEPICWDDVLQPMRITGSCQVPGCVGDKAEFYFKCTHHKAAEDDSNIPLLLLKTNTRRVICITCADVSNPVLVFPCAAAHVVCLDCFRQYCQSRLDDRQFVHHRELGYTLPCPAGCEDSLITEVHHFHVLGKDQYARYKRFGAEECLLRAGGVLCPAPGCGAGILPDPDDRRIVCDRQGGLGCGFIFCRDCYEACHDGECGQRTEQQEGQSTSRQSVDLERERQARWEREESEKTIKKLSKPCPKCRVPVERNGGCMHMTCSRPQCKFEWCWVCSITWNSECLQDHWFGTDHEW